MNSYINHIKIKKLTPTAITPKRQTDGAAGYDLYIDSAEPIEIPPHSTVMVQSNIAFQIPDGFFGAVYARSGLSTKEGIRPATCVSVIDSDYRGEIKVVLLNHSNQPQTLQPGERVAQFVITPVLTPAYEEVEELTDTTRGTGGFGSTGK